MAAKIGAAWKTGESLPRAVTKIDVYRYYFQPEDVTNTRLKWDSRLAQAHDQYGCRSFSLSFKPNGTDSKPFTTTANIESFIKSVPSDVEELLVTFYHEHDGNIKDGSLNMTKYRNGSKQLADVAHQYGAKYGPIHNGMVYDPKKTPKWGLHSSVWSANEADVSLYDFWGVDCYSPNFEDPATRMQPIKTYADSLGLPALIGELGAPAETGTKQEAWCRKARSWALKNTGWAMYWSSQVSADTTDWRLSNASAKSWFGI